MLQRDGSGGGVWWWWWRGGGAFHSLSLSALKISEGKENEFEKKRKGKGWRGCEKQEKYRKKKEERDEEAVF